MLGKPRYLPAGECALVAEFGSTIDPQIHELVLAFDAAMMHAGIAGISETVPTYRSLMIHFDPHLVTTEALIEALENLDYASVRPRAESARWYIPACYDSPHGDDLAAVTTSLGLSQERVIALHLGARYRVYMYGFAPGWTFLGGLPQELGIQRRAVPRPPVAPGALLIAGGQALIAGCAMPTGWHAIGRTPVRVFDARRQRVFLARMGDEICFEQINAAAFDELSRAAAAGELVARREIMDER